MNWRQCALPAPLCCRLEPDKQVEKRQFKGSEHCLRFSLGYIRPQACTQTSAPTHSLKRMLEYNVGECIHCSAVCCPAAESERASLVTMETAEHQETKTLVHLFQRWQKRREGVEGANTPLLTLVGRAMGVSFLTAFPLIHRI